MINEDTRLFMQQNVQGNLYELINSLSSKVLRENEVQEQTNRGKFKIFDKDNSSFPVDKNRYLNKLMIHLKRETSENDAKKLLMCAIVFQESLLKESKFKVTATNSPKLLAATLYLAVAVILNESINSKHWSILTGINSGLVVKLDKVLCQKLKRLITEDEIKDLYSFTL